MDSNITNPVEDSIEKLDSYISNTTFDNMFGIFSEEEFLKFENNIKLSRKSK
jgi:hypothetical protein